MSQLDVSKTPRRKGAKAVTAPAGRVKLNGALTIRELEPARASLMNAIREFPSVAVDCSAATDIDLAFVQLILSARKTASEAGKSLSLAHPATGILLDTLLRGGFANTPGTQPAADQDFWLNQETKDENRSRRG